MYVAGYGLVVVVVANNLLFYFKSSRILISTSSCFKFSWCFCAEFAVVYFFCLYYLYFIIGALSAYSHCNFFVFSVSCCFCVFCFYFLVGALFCRFHSVLVVFLTSEWPVLFCSLFITIIILYSILSFVSWNSATASIFGNKSLVWFLMISQRTTHQIVCIATWTGALHDEACFLFFLTSYYLTWWFCT